MSDLLAMIICYVFLLYTCMCLVLTLLQVPTQPPGTPTFHTLSSVPGNLIGIGFITSGFSGSCRGQT